MTSIIYNLTSGDLGKLEMTDPRTIWKNEAHDFTPWLKQNIQSLSEALGINIEIIARESDVGEFNVDLVGKDVDSDAQIIIENQLEATNHDHLGKLITYAAGKDAKIAIWIATEFRDEHRQAISWLNEVSQSGIQFFGIALKAYKIGTSLPAPYFDVLVKPNSFVKQERTPEGITSTQAAYQKFFNELLQRVKKDIPNFTSASKGQPQNWYDFPSGTSGIVFSTSFSKDSRFNVGVSMNRGSAEYNKTAFDELMKCKDVIEAELALGPLEWDRGDDRQSSAIWISKPASIGDDEAKLHDLQSWVVTILQKFNKTFRDRIAKLPKPS